MGLQVLTSAAEGRRGITVGRTESTLVAPGMGPADSTLVAPGMAPALPFCDGDGTGFGLAPVLLYQTSELSLRVADADDPVRYLSQASMTHLHD